MKDFIEFPFYGSDVWTPVDGGQIYVTGIDSVVRMKLDVHKRSDNWEKFDEIRVDLEIDDQYENRWHCDGILTPEKLWIDKAVENLNTESSLEERSLFVQNLFKNNTILTEIYDLKSTKNSKDYVIENDIVEVYEKNLKCWYDVAFNVGEYANGEKYISPYLWVKLKTQSLYLNIQPIYYEVYLWDILASSPFDHWFQFTKSSTKGKKQKEVLFKPNTPNNGLKSDSSRR